MKIDIQGHRGARGVHPENTISGMLAAIDLGATTLEMDVVVTKDGTVLLSHEPFFSHEISTDTRGNLITKDKELEYNIYQMTFDEVQRYDVGLRPHLRFPQQEKVPATKPSLKQVVQAVEVAHNHRPYYNIEIKRKPSFDSILHPPMREFADLVVGEIKALSIFGRTIVQSFDPATLQYIHQTYPDAKLAYLVGSRGTIESKFDLLGFWPAIYSPYYELVDSTVMAYCQSHDVQVIPWTVNTEEDMKAMLDLGVNGIISDYPGLLARVVEEEGYAPID